VTAVWALGGALILASCGGSTTNGGGAGGTAGSGGTGNASGSGGSGNASTGGSGNATSGGASGFDQCDGPGTCVLVPDTCCGYCGPTDLSKYLAVDQSHLEELSNQLCADPVACPDCISWEEPNYLALCRAGTCTAVDLRTDELSACTGDSDCQLRWGTGCCETCAEVDLVAIGSAQSFGQAVCPTGPAACPPCMPPPYPAGAAAVCEAGHCSVKYSGLGGP